MKCNLLPLAVKYRDWRCFVWETILWHVCTSIQISVNYRLVTVVQSHS